MLGKNQRSSRPQMEQYTAMRGFSQPGIEATRQSTSIDFELAVRSYVVTLGAGGLVAPLPCTAYFGKLAILFD